MSTHHVRPSVLSPLPLERISFSTWQTIRSCPTRLAFQMDPTTKQWSPDNTAAVLGKVSHSLMAACYWGEFVGLSSDNLETLIEDRWDQLMATRIIDLNKNPILAAIPMPERWPSYYQKQFQAIRAVLNVINS